MTDPRDLCYAFLGFQNDRQVQITPSYNRSIADVYTTVSRDIIDGSGNMNIFGVLGRGQSRVGITSLPSWVPDWSAEPTPVPLYASHIQSTFSAAGGRKHRHMATQRLHVHGRPIDVISSIYGTQDFTFSPLQQLSIHDVDIANLLDLDEIFVSILSIWPENMPELSRSRLLRTILAEGAYPGEAEHILMNEAFNGLQDWRWEELLAAYDHWDRIRASDNDPSEYETTLNAAALLAYSQVIKNRRVVVTKDWRLGIVPKDARVGDYVCILDGSHTPVILRMLSNGTYSVVGQAYIENVMRGEAVQQSNVREVDFVLT